MTTREVGERLLAEALREGSRPVRAQVRGHCMTPLLDDGDWVRVMPAPARPRRGAIALARTETGDWVCHRILRSTRSGLTLAGDRSSSPSHHSSKAVLGVVSGVERGNRLLPLDGRLWRSAGAILAWLHLVSLSLRGSGAGRKLETLRHLLLRLGGLTWHASESLHR